MYKNLIGSTRSNFSPQLHLFLGTLLGLLDLWLGYQLYRFAYEGLDMFPLLIAIGLSGILLLGLELQMFGRAWQTYTECELAMHTAKIVSLYPILVNSILITVGVICSFAGGLASPLAEPGNFEDFVIGLVLMLALFYPFHIIGVALGIGGRVFISKASVVIVNEKEILTFSEFVLGIEKKIYEFLSRFELQIEKWRLMGGRNWVIFVLLFLGLVCVGGYVAEGRYFALCLLISGGVWFLLNSPKAGFNLLSQSRYAMLPFFGGLVLTVSSIGGYTPLIVGLGLTMILSLWQGVFKYPPELRVAFRHFNAGELIPALQLTNSVVRNRPDYWVAYQLRSGINLGLFKIIPAEKDARMALSLKSNNHLSYQALGSSLMLQSRYAEAESAYSQALLLMPKYGLHHFNIGLVSYRLGKFDEAGESFQSVLRQHLPFTQVNLLASYYLAHIVEIKGERLRARHLFLKLRQFSSGYKRLIASYHNAPDYPAVSLMREELEDIKKYIE